MTRTKHLHAESWFVSVFLLTLFFVSIISFVSIDFHTKDFGFCWGVERSIALAYEAVEHFPNRKIHITNELIHNPEVNDKLSDMNVQFIEKLGEGQKNFQTVEEGDVVILPAFGASFEEMDYLDKNVRKWRDGSGTLDGSISIILLLLTRWIPCSCRMSQLSTQPAHG